MDHFQRRLITTLSLLIVLVLLLVGCTAFSTTPKTTTPSPTVSPTKKNMIPILKCAEFIPPAGGIQCADNDTGAKLTFPDAGGELDVAATRQSDHDPYDISGAISLAKASIGCVLIDTIVTRDGRENIAACVGSNGNAEVLFQLGDIKTSLCKKQVPAQTEATFYIIHQSGGLRVKVNGRGVALLSSLPVGGVGFSMTGAGGTMSALRLTRPEKPSRTPYSYSQSKGSTPQDFTCWPYEVHD